MAAQHVPTLGRPPRAHGHQGATAVGIAVVLVLTAGVGLWLAGRDNEQTATVEPAAPVPVVRSAGRTAATPRSQSVYLVSTPEEAGQVATLMAALGAEPRVDEVWTLVVRSDAEARLIRDSVAQVNRLRDAEGLAPIQLVDWLQQPTQGGGGGTTTAGGQSTGEVNFTP